MFAPSMPPQVIHMWIAAFMVTGFGIASVYAVGMLRRPKEAGTGTAGTGTATTATGCSSR